MAAVACGGGDPGSDPDSNAPGGGEPTTAIGSVQDPRVVSGMAEREELRACSIIPFAAARQIDILAGSGVAYLTVGGGVAYYQSRTELHRAPLGSGPNTEIVEPDAGTSGSFYLSSTHLVYSSYSASGPSITLVPVAGGAPIVRTVPREFITLRRTLNAATNTAYYARVDAATNETHYVAQTIDTGAEQDFETDLHGLVTLAAGPSDVYLSGGLGPGNPGSANDVVPDSPYGLYRLAVGSSVSEQLELDLPPPFSVQGADADWVYLWYLQIGGPVKSGFYRLPRSGGTAQFIEIGEPYMDSLILSPGGPLFLSDNKVLGVGADPSVQRLLVPANEDCKAESAWSDTENLYVGVKTSARVGWILTVPWSVLR